MEVGNSNGVAFTREDPDRWRLFSLEVGTIGERTGMCEIINAVKNAS